MTRRPQSGARAWGVGRRGVAVVRVFVSRSSTQGVLLGTHQSSNWVVGQRAIGLKRSKMGRIRGVE
jgi:hypothetical protein